jgi:hypothetical protein
VNEIIIMPIFANHPVTASSRRKSGSAMMSFRSNPPRRTTDEIGHLEWIAHWLDDGFQVPNVGIRFGWDAIAKLVPVFGDMLGLIASLYLFQSFRKFGLRRVTLARMALNIAIDYFVGLIPLVGTVFDVFWKPNVWNVALLRRHLASANTAASMKARRQDWIFLIATSLIIVMLFAISVVAAYWLLLKIVHLLSTL